MRNTVKMRPCSFASANTYGQRIEIVGVKAPRIARPFGHEGEAAPFY